MDGYKSEKTRFSLLQVVAFIYKISYIYITKVRILVKQMLYCIYIYFTLNTGNGVVIMRKKLTRTGNSHALVIPPAYLDILKITKDTELEVTIEDGKIVAFPVRKEFDWNSVPEEDEELSKEEIESMKRGEADIKAGRVVDADEVWKRLGI
jgi:antitoxin component of MazEF toxin-antitoxin module